MRVFIAIQLSQKIKRSLERVIHDMRKSGAKGNYTDPENMHITLARRVSVPYPICVQIPDTSMEVTQFSLMKLERRNGRIKYTEIMSWDSAN